MFLPIDPFWEKEVTRFLHSNMVAIASCPVMQYDWQRDFRPYSPEPLG